VKRKVSPARFLYPRQITLRDECPAATPVAPEHPAPRDRPSSGQSDGSPNRDNRQRARFCDPRSSPEFPAWHRWPRIFLTPYRQKDAAVLRHGRSGENARKTSRPDAFRAGNDCAIAAHTAPARLPRHVPPRCPDAATTKHPMPDQRQSRNRRHSCGRYNQSIPARPGGGQSRPGPDTGRHGRKQQKWACLLFNPLVDVPRTGNCYRQTAQACAATLYQSAQRLTCRNHRRVCILRTNARRSGGQTAHPTALATG